MKKLISSIDRSENSLDSQANLRTSLCCSDVYESFEKYDLSIVNLLSSSVFR
jgi:hypothetical protein